MIGPAPCFRKPVREAPAFLLPMIGIIRFNH